MKKSNWTKRAVCTLLALFLGPAASAVANAAYLQITYTGQFELLEGTDPPGLDGASFTWQALFDEAAFRASTNGSNVDAFAAVAPITLTLLGTTGGVNDGIYNADSNLVGEYTSAIFDFYGPFGEFSVGGSELFPGNVFVASGFTGAVSPTNTITPVNTADVTDFDQWAWFEESDNPESLNVYAVTNGQITSATLNAPVANDDAYGATEDTELVVAAPGVLSNDTDADDDSLTAILDVATSHGSLTLNDDGSFSYIPELNYCGPDSFTYHASDGVLDSNIATVSIDVACVTDPATFLVTKSFSDGSPAEVEVTLTCNGGLPLEQKYLISEGHPVKFTLTSYSEGAVDCEIVETSQMSGYTASYDNGTVVSETACTYLDLTEGEHSCAITNAANPATFTVYKYWEVDGAGGDAVDTSATVSVQCASRIIMAVDGVPLHNYLDQVTTSLEGDGASVTVTLTTADGPASCWALEEITQSGVESASDCGQRSIPAGSSSSCSITNTVFFEGIPTLSQWGQALMVLLMLGIGLVGLRRIV